MLVLDVVPSSMTSISGRARLGSGLLGRNVVASSSLFESEEIKESESELVAVDVSSDASEEVSEGFADMSSSSSSSDESSPVARPLLSSKTPNPRF